MNHSFSNTFNLEDSADYPNTEYHDNSQFFSNSSQVPVTQSPHSSQNTHDESRTSKWEAAEDVALMSAYVMVSEDATRGKNQKRESLWARVKKCMMKLEQKIPKGLEAYRRKRSGMSQHDIEREAHIIYEQAGKGKFLEDAAKKKGKGKVSNEVVEELRALKLARGRAPNVSYTVNGRDYNMAYYLTDGIYPSWAAFVKSITSPQLRKHKLFAQQQEAVRKDVERAFGVLQARFAFLRHPCLVWDKEMMRKVMSACITIHNMIVEDERDTYLHYYDPSEFLNSSTEVDEHAQFSMERIANLSQYMTNRAQLRNRETHNVLKHDLIEHKKKKQTSMEEETTTVIYSYNNDPNQPEETETIVSKNQSNSITKRYKGVWRKNGRWVARIRNPISNSREFLGKFGSCEAALSAYFKKKHEFEVLVRDVEVVDSVMIDNHGFLLGEFSRLDEDLRIL
uniref:AP2/ERF domain-containing protein n=1 Tax=Tanacetum cinerariifolium TaxID=118510 RepID=A0A6L2LRP8_TANCI|nr:hypothetical protein [Tanacetum cinerariifolium]